MLKFVSRVEASDPIGHHPGVQFQEEGLQLAQPALRLLPLLLAALPFLVNPLILPLLFLIIVHPGHPGAAVLTGVCSRVVGREVNRHGRLVVVSEPSQQLLDHIWPLVRHVLPLVRVAGDVEQPDVFVGGGFVEGREDALKVPPAAEESGEDLGTRTG